MKSPKYFIMLALMGVALSSWQCGDDSPAAPDPRDEQLTKLSKTWKATSVTLTTGSGTQPVSGWDNFQIVMSGTAGQDTFNYTTSGRPSGTVPWSSAGTFQFGTDFGTILNRDDGTVVTYSVNATQLQMTFNYTGAGYTSRVGVVNGTWSFTFGL